MTKESAGEEIEIQSLAMISQRVKAILEIQISKAEGDVFDVMALKSVTEMARAIYSLMNIERSLGTGLQDSKSFSELRSMFED